MLDQTNTIQDISNLNLSLFGIGITLLTVLISFTISKKDEVKVYSDVYKTSSMDLSLKGKIVYSIKYIKRLRKAIIHIGLISAMSILSYMMYWIDKFLDIGWIVYAMIIITFICLVYIITLIINTLLFFWRYTNT